MGTLVPLTGPSCRPGSQQGPGSGEKAGPGPGVLPYHPAASRGLALISCHRQRPKPAGPSGNDGAGFQPSPPPTAMMWSNPLPWPQQTETEVWGETGPYSEGSSSAWPPPTFLSASGLLTPHHTSSLLCL